MELALSAASFPASSARRRAAVTVALALTLGGLTQALFWRTGLGVNFWLWDLVVLASEVVLFARRDRSLAPAAWGAITCSVLLASSVVLRASDWTLAIAVPADLAILAVLPFLLRDRPTLDGLAAVPGRALRSVRTAPKAAAEAAHLAREAVAGGRPFVGATKGLLLGVPAAGLFALLLSGDDDFRHALGAVTDRCGEGVLFVGWSLATAAAYLVASGLPVARQEIGNAYVPGPYRGAGDLPFATPPRATAPRVTAVAWAMVVGQVALVFGVFVLANLRHLFGGRALVRAPGAPTYASYLHAGVTQLLFATALSVCLVLAGHRLLRPRDELGRLAPVPGGTTLRALEGTLLALTGVTVASCAQRLAIYEEAYGATHERLGVALVAFAILGVLVLTIAKVMARGWRGHGGATLTFLAGLAVFASAVNADAYVASTNLDRSARGKDLDVEYLTRLSGDARSALSHPYVVANSDLSSLLTESFCHAPDTGWRARRGFGHCAP